MTIYKKSFTSFRLYCVEAEQLPVEFHIVLSDIIAGAGIYAYFTLLKVRNRTILISVNFHAVASDILA